MVITIDGPAGTGKSTVAQAVARRLGFDFLDTGAMYRAVGLAALRAGCDLENPIALAPLAAELNVDFDWSAAPPIILLNAEPVAHLLRDEPITRAASLVAVSPDVRRQLVATQQRIGAERGNLVTEGRDQGTVAFPHAELKIYLDADPAERARRRVAQLRKLGTIAEPAAVLEQIRERDRRDASRSVGPMRIAADAQVIDSTALTEVQVIDRIVDIARAVGAGQVAAANSAGCKGARS